MAFRLAFETDNAAFDEWNKNSEIIRILQKTIKTLAVDDTERLSEIIHDNNGNAIGSWHLD